MVKAQRPGLVVCACAPFLLIVTCKMQSLYALLVGIDRYPDPVPGLEGCVNDANAIQDLLEKRFGGATLHIQKLTDADATRAKIIRTFRQHLGQAQPGDIALFFFAGHGSLAPTGGLFKEIKPGEFFNSIVCHDSRLPGAYDLVDKDLATLIGEVTARGVHLTAITDSCHSESVTRGTLRVRGIGAREDAQPLEAFLPQFAAGQRSVEGADDEVADPAAGLTLADAQNFVPDATGLHVHLAACEDKQSAKEYLRHGAFTYFLTQTVNATSQPLGYEELIRLVRERMKSRVPDQTPKLSSLAGDASLQNAFLGLTPSPLTEFSLASYAITGDWEIDSGSLNCISQCDRFALYPSTAADADIADPARAITTAIAGAVRPAASVLRIDDELKLDSANTYKAVLTARAATIGVAFEGDADGVALLRAAAASSHYIHEGPEPRFTVRADRGMFQLTDAGANRSPVAPLAQNADNARFAIAALEHMARWTMRLELRNPSTRIPVDAVQFTIVKADGSDLNCPPNDMLELPYTTDDLGQLQRPSFKVRITNRFNKDLYIALPVFAESWSISTGLIAEGRQKLAPDPNDPLFARAGQPVHTSIDTPGASETTDELLLIVSTDPFDAFAFKQPALADLGTRGDLQAAGPPPEIKHDFMTRRFTLHTTRKPQ
jgi:hypothetical protein